MNSNITQSFNVQHFPNVCLSSDSVDCSGLRTQTVLHLRLIYNMWQLAYWPLCNMFKMISFPQQCSCCFTSPVFPAHVGGWHWCVTCWPQYTRDQEIVIFPSKCVATFQVIQQKKIKMNFCFHPLLYVILIEGLVCEISSRWCQFFSWKTRRRRHIKMMS